MDYSNIERMRSAGGVGAASSIATSSATRQLNDQLPKSMYRNTVLEDFYRKMQPLREMTSETNFPETANIYRVPRGHEADEISLNSLSDFNPSGGGGGITGGGENSLLRHESRSSQSTRPFILFQDKPTAIYTSNRKRSTHSGLVSLNLNSGVGARENLTGEFVAYDLFGAAITGYPTQRELDNCIDDFNQTASGKSNLKSHSINSIASEYDLPDGRKITGSRNPTDDGNYDEAAEAASMTGSRAATAKKRRKSTANKKVMFVQDPITGEIITEKAEEGYQTGDEEYDYYKTDSVRSSTQSKPENVKVIKPSQVKVRENDREDSTSPSNDSTDQDVKVKKDRSRAYKKRRLVLKYPGLYSKINSMILAFVSVMSVIIQLVAMFYKAPLYIIAQGIWSGLYGIVLVVFIFITGNPILIEFF